MRWQVTSSSLLASLLICLLLPLCACKKNEVTLQGQLEGGAGQTINLAWRAMAAKQDFMTSQAVPLTASPFKAIGPMKYPTVIWVFGTGHNLLFSIYAERGNTLTLSGQMANPATWRVKGNKVMEEVTSFLKVNERAIALHQTKAVNQAVATFVKKNPDSRTALFLLLTRYDRAQGSEYPKLLASFPDSDMKREMLRACLEPDESGQKPLPASLEEKINRALHPQMQEETPSYSTSLNFPD